MASIRTRTTRTGDTTHQVLYRQAGRQTSVTFTTVKAARRFKDLIDLLGVDRAVAELTATTNHGPTLDQLADRWLDWKSTDVTPRTLADYRRDYDNWIRPTLGHRHADSIDERDIQTLIDDIAQRLDPKSVRDKHMIIGGIYRYAAARSRRLVDHNPCLETQLPKKRRKAVRGISLAEWAAIHAAAVRLDPDAADLLLFIVTTGWRWSEATALTGAGVEDHDVEGMFVSVQRVVRRDGRQRFTIAEGDAKTRAGVRRVKVGRLCADVVRRRTMGRGPGDMVFTNRHGRVWNQTNFLNRTWTRIVADAGLDRRPTPHELRHTHVALLDRGGASVAEMQRRLGHESVQTTLNVYGGMIDGVTDETLAAVDHLLAGPTVVPGVVVAGAVVSELERPG